MKKLISLSYRTSLRRLYNGQHFRFYDKAVLEALLSLMNSMPQLSGMYNALQTVFNKEDALFKLSQGSILTQDIALLNGKRIVYFSHLWSLVSFFKYENTQPDIQEALQKLEFLHNIYKNMIYAGYSEMSGLMINFLQDCEKPEYKPFIQLLGLTGIVNKIKAAEEEFDSLYDERAYGKEQISQMGKLTEVRVEVDDAFVGLVDGINFTWTSNEMGAKDPALRAKLIEARDHIVAAIHQIELDLAHRGHHKPKDDDKKDEETQSPDITNPEPPETTDPDTPTTQNPSDEPHHLDPNEHPPAGE